MELSTSQFWMSRHDGNAETIAEIVSRAINGDRTAFEEIVLLHERRVLTLAYRLLGTAEDAQDAAQEVFLRAFRYLRRFDPTKPMEPWLVRMTVNVCHVAGRKRLKNRSVLVQAEIPDFVDPGKNPHAQLYAEEQKQLLYDALGTLGEKERAAVVLRDIEGFTTAEVAEILGTVEATVRSQISFARLKIRKSLAMKKGVRDGLS